MGFVPRADYVSNVFDFGEELALWGNIRWEEEFVGTERFSRLSTSSRSGWDDTPLVFTEKAEVKMCLGGQMRSLPHRGRAAFLDDISDVQEALAIYDALGHTERNSIALTQAEYEALSSSKKGAVSDDLLGWSRWSPPYSIGGDAIRAENIGDDALHTPILSPGPRRYFQIKAEFFSDELQSARLLGSTVFHRVQSAYRRAHYQRGRPSPG